MSYKVTIDKVISDICTNWYTSLLTGIKRESYMASEFDREKLSSTESENQS